MNLSIDELRKISQQEDMLKGNLNRMCLTNSYEGLELNCMIAKDRIENIYEILCDHLAADYDKEVEKKLKEEEEKESDELEEMLRDLWNATVEDHRKYREDEDWHDVPSGEMTLEQAQQAVKDLRKSRAEHIKREIKYISELTQKAYEDGKKDGYVQAKVERR